jgi:hypothetical protein
MRTSKRDWVARVGWLFALWCAGVGAVAVASVLLRLLMTVAGMKGAS